MYLILHGAIWLALQEYRSFQVKLWCASGMLSGMAVVLLSMRGLVSEFLFLYVAQLLMLAGNGGRMVALRMYLLPESQNRVYWTYGLACITYFILFVYLMAVLNADWEALILFNAFYAVLCIDYFRIGLQLHRKRKSLGANLLMWGGLILSFSLAMRTIGVALGGSIDELYQPSWHQAIMVVGQFITITLCNVAFLRIFLEIAEQKKMAVAHEMTLTNERADEIQRTSLILKQLLEEREEIIRQLTLFNKTAGMGALVASLAHELNQPLSVIQTNAGMIELVLNDHESKLDQDPRIDRAMTGLRNANQRAATIISTLRNMFGQGPKTISSFDFNELVKDVILLCQPTFSRHGIQVQIQLHSEALNFTGDKSQLQQVLLNLITNAIEAFPATFEGLKNITIQTNIESNRIVMSVADNGVGISPEIEAVVFELLRTNKESGMGIGLWLSKTIIDSHQGNISFTTQVNQGTRFVVTLPLTTEKMFF
ncbi:MAG: HAMP domain-containing sensor histidine kinase [Limnohabitans sp.]